ncbi:1-acylglycerol-3-phosphate O-acyltransferase PNPLA3-like isoform X3 [Diceros bicornis minor]|uniref:1-acylglycerol-3-phosphate O-acyltransferase PNPLA3-like isoform X3 n=1 Tax=Diceros bicornis minor TaxID=77932 RepID=UPI0026EB2158|nr:1-acylglycerol-3-phosphate O-acyltransferase PNPLA3-like isoform X3 [Diceros bicornis minor]
MCDPERGWSLSFSGCGFLASYHIGVTCCLSDRAPRLLRDARMFFGASSGALHCVAFLAGMSPHLSLQIIMDLCRSARSRNIGIFHPSFSAGRSIRENLHRHLPANVHQLISGKMFISLTRVSDGENVLVSDFQSKDEVVDALLCSSFIPFYVGLIPPSFRGVRYVDGGVSNNMPFFDAKTTITVSPFYGECDICPKALSTNFLYMDFTKLSVRLCSENVYLMLRALFPPDLKVLGALCLQGYLDAVRFLEEKALSEAVKHRDGYMSKICNFLPIKVMSYVMLPCTLPVEYTIAVIQRIVTWLPDIPDDIQWLQQMTSQICSRVMTRLLPTSSLNGDKQETATCLLPGCGNLLAGTVEWDSR